MEPITHLLTGAVLARTGFNRRAAYATVAMVIAAELPDLDVVSSFFGPVTGLEHHRGITHTFIALPIEAAIVTAAFYAFHRLRKNPSARRASTHWPILFTGCLLALLSHLLLDWTNNYGLRPFFPFNPHWYAGSFVFIFEPILFLIVLGALILPALFGLINSEVGYRKPAFPGRALAFAALIAIAALYLFRFNEHSKALRLAALNQPDQTTRIFASPHPTNPFLWHVVTDTPAFLQLSTVDTRTATTLPSIPSDTLYKPQTTLPLLAAKRTYLGRIYLDWSQYPILSEAPSFTDANHPLTPSLITVTFSDARFLYDVSILHGRTHPPLSGSVTLDMAAPEGDRVIETEMDGRHQH